jgi:hypothetical protein
MRYEKTNEQNATVEIDRLLMAGSGNLTNHLGSRVSRSDCLCRFAGKVGAGDTAPAPSS